MSARARSSSSPTRREGLRADRIWFMEMNTRLQVEHPVTEEITGVRIWSNGSCAWRAGETLPKRQDELAINGWAMEARLYAEDPAKGFLPSDRAGSTISTLGDDRTAAIETGVEEGDAISPFYDPMIAKLIVHGEHATRRRPTRSRDMLRRRRSGRSRPMPPSSRALLARSGVSARATSTPASSRATARRAGRRRRARRTCCAAGAGDALAASTPAIARPRDAMADLARLPAQRARRTRVLRLDGDARCDLSSSTSAIEPADARARRRSPHGARRPGRRSGQAAPFSSYRPSGAARRRRRRRRDRLADAGQDHRGRGRGRATRWPRARSCSRSRR